MRKPLLVQVIPTLGGGGAEREIARASVALKNNSPFDVIICCLMGRGSYADMAEKAGVDLVILSDRKQPLPVAACNLLRFLRKMKPVIVHSHIIRWAPPIARLAGVPVVIASSHCWVPSLPAWRITYERFCARFADRIVGVAEAVSKQQIEDFKIPEKKVVTVVNALEPEAFNCQKSSTKRLELGIPEGVPVIVNVGRLSPQKAQHVFIDAAYEIIRTRPDCRFLILGEGPLRSSLESQIRQLGVEENVKLLGFRDDAREIVSAMDVFCLSSDYEGTPITALEAMACGKAVVITDVGGCREVISDHETGLIVKPGDPGAISSAILEIIKDNELSGRIGQAGLEKVRTVYSAERNLSRLVALYSDILKSKGCEINLESGS